MKTESTEVATDAADRREMKRLEFLRRRRGWSQKYLGNRTRIDQAFISLTERGLGLPSADQLQRLGDALGADPSTLLESVGD